MKTLFILQLIPAIFASVAALGSDQSGEDWGPASNCVQMAISLKANSDVIATNEDFALLVRLKNLTDTNVATFLESVPSTDLTGGLSCAITSPSGKDISPKVIYYNVSGRGLNVASHKVSEFEFRLSAICKFDEVGTYRIVASKEILLDKNKGWIVVSNPLLVTVVSTNTITTNALPPINKTLQP